MSKSPMVSGKGLIKNRTQGYLGLSGGDFFGEISLIFNGPRMAGVWTTKTTELLELEKGDFDHAVGAYPSIKGTLTVFWRKRLELTRYAISSRTKKAMVTMA